MICIFCHSSEFSDWLVHNKWKLYGVFYFNYGIIVCPSLDVYYVYYILDLIEMILI